MSDPRFEVNNPNIVEILRTVGAIVDSAVYPTGHGFCLCIFEFEGADFFYITNAERKSMCKALQEFIDRQDKEENKQKEFNKRNTD